MIGLCEYGKALVPLGYWKEQYHAYGMRKKQRYQPPPGATAATVITIIKMVSLIINK
jgi:hypothetical protein